MMTDLNLIPSPTAPAGFPFLENHVRARLGIGTDEVRALRQASLRPEKDWCLRKKRIWLAQSGVDALLSAKGLSPALTRPSAQTASAVAGGAVPSTPATAANPKKIADPKEPVILRVVQVTRNPRIIQCCAEGESALAPKKMVRVRVRDAKNFRRHMTLPATLVAGYTDLYDLARACPKKPGKW